MMPRLNFDNPYKIVIKQTECFHKICFNFNFLLMLLYDIIYFNCNVLLNYISYMLEYIFLGQCCNMTMFYAKVVIIIIIIIIMFINSFYQTKIHVCFPA